MKSARSRPFEALAVGDVRGDRKRRLPAWLWPAERSPSRLKQAAREALWSLARTPAGRRALKILLKDHETRCFVFQHLSNSLVERASFARDAPETARLERFENCAWLYSSNPLNHGLSRVSISEAAHIYDVVRSLDEPRAAEIGRYRGGTTFLLAAAGARVLSVDLASDRQQADDLQLANSLEWFGLEDQVELALADSQSYRIENRRFDVVFVDGDHAYEGVRADFENWWPTVHRGGHFLFHDAIPDIPLSQGIVRLVEEIRRRDDAAEVLAPDTLVHFVKRTEADPALRSFD
jgi:predicted O-methyltransferase YrrM